MLKFLFILSFILNSCSFINKQKAKTSDVVANSKVDTSVIEKKAEEVDYSSMKPYREYKKYALSFPSGKEIFEWNSPEGLKRFEQSKYKKSFFNLAHHFAGQYNAVTCAAASGRIVLSALYEKMGQTFLIDPKRTLLQEKNGMFRPYFSMTEENIFLPGSPNEYDVVSRNKINPKTNTYSDGLDMADLATIMSMHQNVSATYFNVDKLYKGDIENFRKAVKETLDKDNCYMIVNYHLALTYPYPSGHTSPIAAYDEKTDSVLIMDVAAFLGIWTWVDLSDLYRNMYSVLNGNDRGYIIACPKSKDLIKSENSTAKLNNLLK